MDFKSVLVKFEQGMKIKRRSFSTTEYISLFSKEDRIVNIKNNNESDERRTESLTFKGILADDWMYYSDSLGQWCDDIDDVDDIYGTETSIEEVVEATEESVEETQEEMEEEETEGDMFILLSQRKKDGCCNSQTTPSINIGKVTININK